MVVVDGLCGFLQWDAGCAAVDVVGYANHVWLSVVHSLKQDG